MAVTESQLARDLQELITALDGRAARMEKPGEASIAREAAVLRASAVQRLLELDDHESTIDRQDSLAVR